MNKRTLPRGAKAFGEILAEAGNGLRERAYRYTLALSADEQEAKDLTQDALYRALKTTRGCDPRRSPVPWLRTIVRNAHLDSLRRRQSRRQQSLDAMSDERGPGYEPVAQGPGPLDELLARKTASEVNEALGGLLREHRRTLRLRHRHGMTYEEIAKATRAPLGTVRSRLARAADGFRRLYGERGYTL